MKTSTIPPLAPKWLLIDAEGQSIGRLSAQVAMLLRGKHRPEFSPHQLCGDQVVVINAAKLNIHPTKLYRKEYRRHTGFLGHLKTMTLKELMDKDPTQVIQKAVKGMLPSNRLRPQMLKRLHISVDEKHGHDAQKPVPFPL
ncbi:50S ribosomal protein L13 [Patescibacteria group bacterium]|nr:50S ribosomal protein L13 [Patescibacteria group bacterium]